MTMCWKDFYFLYLFKQRVPWKSWKGKQCVIVCLEFDWKMLHGFVYMLGTCNHPYIIIFIYVQCTVYATKLAKTVQLCLDSKNERIIYVYSLLCYLKSTNSIKNANDRISRFIRYLQCYADSKQKFFFTIWDKEYEIYLK